MLAPPNYVFTIFAFIAFFLCLIKYPMQLHAWNVGTHLFLAWVGLDCLFFGINSIIWNHNTINWAPVWCDITIRFFYGASYAIPAAVLCINRRLYLLASPTSVLPSQADKRREFIIDLVIGIGLPIVEMILLFFAQDARFQIFEDNGCYPLLTATWVSIAIAFVPLILLQLISGVYGCLSIRAFYKHRSKLRDSECSISRNLNQNRYIRLMVFSACDLLVGAPLTVFYLYGGLPLFPFRGITEKDHTRVRQVPAVLWRATTIRELNVELMRWIMVLCAFVYFAIFGFTQESRNNYRAALRSVVQVFIMITGIKTRPSSKAEEITFKPATREPDTMNSNVVV